MTPEDAALGLFAEIKRRLGPLASRLTCGEPPDPTTLGDDWKAKWATWWAVFLTQASSLLPDDEQIAGMATTWSMVVQEGTLPMIQKAADLMGREPSLDDLRNFLKKQ